MRACFMRERERERKREGERESEKERDNHLCSMTDLSAGVLFACKGAHTLFIGQSEREREREREKEEERERDIKRGRERGS